MKKYTIELRGCDDSNEFEVWLTESELEVVQELAKMSIDSSEYNCQPRMFIEEVK